MSKFVDKIKLPTEIEEAEKHLYHVVIVEANFNQTQLEATYKSKVQKYDVKSWLANKERFKQIGVANIYVIHDPTQEGKGGNQTGEDAGKGKDGDAGADGGETPQDKRKALIERAKALGYEGALNVKNELLEEFIKNAEANGNQTGEDEDADAGAEE